MTDKIIKEAQKAVPDRVVILLELDATAIGGAIGYFTPEFENPDAPIVNWRGNEYLPTPFSAEGFEMSSSGQFPRPRLIVSNILGILQSEMIQFNNLIGATITRWRTFAKHLDDGSDPDPDIYFPPDVFKIDRKAMDTSENIEFELSTVLDQQGVQLPRRQVLRTTCTHIYRYYSETLGGFDYQRATCPYAGNNYFDDQGVPTPLPQNDRCSKLVETGCKKRFPNEALPTRAFPGVGRFR